MGVRLRYVGRFGIRPRYTGDDLGSVYAMQVNFLGSVYVLQVNFWVSPRSTGEVSGLSTFKG